MEPTTSEPARSGPNPASVAHQPRVTGPVMDVVPPPAAPSVATPPPAGQTNQVVAEAPDVRPAPAETADDLLASEIQAAAPQAELAHASLPPKQHSTTATAIGVTITIIVLLAGLAIFAYLQSK